MTTLLASVIDIRTADQRWTDWVARGVAQDRISHRRAVGLLMGIAWALAVWVAIGYILG
jgi:hypothetical protein